MRGPAMDCARVRERLLDHAYGALEAEDEAALVAHLEDCAACRGAMREAEADRGLLGEASRENAGDLNFRPPGVLWAWRRTLRLDYLRRWGRVPVAAAAVLLGVAVTLGARHHARAVALEEYPRVVVTGPRAMVAGEPARYSVAVTTVDGDPLEARVTAVASAASGGAAQAEAPTGEDGVADLAFDRSPGEPGERVGIRFAVTLPDGEPRDFATAAVRDGRRILARVGTDRPIYRPGETVRARIVALERFRLIPAGRVPFRCRLIDPRGGVIALEEGECSEGVGAWAADLPKDAPGGEYRLEVEDPEGRFPAVDRALLVRDYRTPRIRGDLELDRDSYGPGDRGVLRASLRRIEGGVPALATVEAVLLVDGKVKANTVHTLPSSGLLAIPFEVPADLGEGRGTIALIVRDGGVVETLTKPLPLATGRLRIETFPEGGDLVAGLASRVYFRVRDPAGRPADLEADVLDGAGTIAARLRVDALGMGRFDLVPAAGAAYRIVPRRPAGIELAGSLPPVAARGVTLRTLADAAAPGAALTMEVASTEGGEHRVKATCRGVLVAEAAVRLEPGRPARLDLRPKEPLGGVFRITVLDPAGTPRAERLVAVAPPRRLALDVRPSAAAASPGQRISVEVRARGEDDSPARAFLGAAVVDEAAFAAAGGEAPASLPLHFLVGLEVEELERAEVFEGGPGVALAVDLLLGVQGWRRFSWRDPAAFAARSPGGSARVEPLSLAAESPVRLDNGESARASVEYEVDAVERVFYGIWGVVGSLLLAAALFSVLSEFLRQHARVARPAAMVVLVFMVAIPVVFLVGSVIPKAQRSSGGYETHARLAMDSPSVDMEAEFIPEEARINVSNHLNWGGVPFSDTGEDDRPPFPAVTEIPEADPAPRRPIPVREYAVSHRRGPAEDGVRRDFEEVLFWDPLLRTDEHGRASFSFETPDSVTSFRIAIEGHDGTGRLGAAAAPLRNRIPFFLEPRLPAALSAGDRLDLPVAVANDSDAALDVLARVVPGGDLVRLAEPGERRVPVAAGGRARALFPLVASAGSGSVSLAIEGRGPGGLSDRSVRILVVEPRGYPVAIERAGVLEGAAGIPVDLPGDFVAGSWSGDLRLYPSVAAELRDGVESLLEEPHGCFEQVSSSTYPNALALAVMRETGTGSPESVRRAKDLLARGYRQLAAYECPRRGFEWWGKDPGHEALTAYGLLEFADMARVLDVDAAMVERTREWLLGRRDGAGGFRRDAGGYDGFSRGPAAVADAYILWALTESGMPLDLDRELARVEERARASDDPYLVALAARTLGNRELPGARGLRERLAKMQEPDGRFPGRTTSITGSVGTNLDVETTALAALALLREPAEAGRVASAMRYLASQRHGGGRFGSTQATVLALKALVEYARASRRAAADHALEVSVNGNVVAARRVEAGEAGTIVLGGEVVGALRPGRNHVTIRTTGAEPLPFALRILGRAAVPPSDPSCPVEVAARLAGGEAVEGGTLALSVEVANRTASDQGMVVARVGLPAGLEARSEDLKALRESGSVDSWETRTREVTVYFRGLRAGETRRFALDLVAAVPGEFEGAPSVAYLYYGDDRKRWSPPLRVRVIPATR